MNALLQMSNEQLAIRNGKKVVSEQLLVVSKADFPAANH
jgi:hypothetical protein